MGLSVFVDKERLSTYFLSLIIKEKGDEEVNTEDKIINHIMEMDENEAKAKFAELMLNYHRITIGNYSKENCMRDYESIYKKIVLRDLFKPNK